MPVQEGVYKNVGRKVVLGHQLDMKMAVVCVTLQMGIT